MELIKINIVNKRPTVDGTPVIVCNNKYKILFAFDDEWGDATEMKARFVWRREGKLLHQDIPITDNAVEIPILTKVHCVHVGVHANELHTTTPAKIECEYSILCHSGETSQGLPPNNTGNDGFSPIAKVTQTSTGATIEITDKKGTTTATITNGKDGVDGKDGRNGVDGKNGQDGYTPQKGVDYFDGKDGKDGSNGKDGTNGKDGYTPVKGKDYFDGADGKDGVDGKDYVLTEADKEEIAEMTSERFPLYDGTYREIYGGEVEDV